MKFKKEKEKYELNLLLDMNNTKLETLKKRNKKRKKRTLEIWGGGGGVILRVLRNIL